MYVSKFDSTYSQGKWKMSQGSIISIQRKTTFIRQSKVSTTNNTVKRLERRVVARVQISAILNPSVMRDTTAD